MNGNFLDDLRGIQREMLRILGEVSTMTSNPLTMNPDLDDKWKPRCDVYGTEEELNIRFDIAGIDRKSVSITTGPEYLKISGKRLFPSDGRDIVFYNMEIESGDFERKIYFPDLNIDKTNPATEYRDGFLILTFKVIPTEEKPIPIHID